MIYYYFHNVCPNLDNLETLILESTIADTYKYLRWDSDDNNLKVVLTSQLSEEEKNILDNLVQQV